MKKNNLRLLFLSYFYKKKSDKKQLSYINSTSDLKNHISQLKFYIQNAYQQISSLDQNQSNRKMTTIRQQIETEEQDSFKRTIKSMQYQIKYTQTILFKMLELYKTQLTNLALETVKLKKNLENEKQSQRPFVQETKYKYRHQSPEGKENENSNQKDKEEKKINIKLQNLKKKIKSYQEQIKDKNICIDSLKKELEKQKEKSVQNKTIKIMLTTLRGQKSMLNSQYTSLKKLLNHKDGIIQSQLIQIQKLKQQVEKMREISNQNFRELNKLKQNSFQNLNTKNQKQRRLQKIEKQYYEYLKQYPHKQFQQIKQKNQILLKNINEAELNFKKLNDKFMQLQNAYKRDVLQDKNHILNLEKLMKEKNQTIINLKTSKNEEKYSYYTQLIKLLNKKILDKDQLIFQLRNQLSQA